MTMRQGISFDDIRNITGCERFEIRGDKKGGRFHIGTDGVADVLRESVDWAKILAPGSFVDRRRDLELVETQDRRKVLDAGLSKISAASENPVVNARSVGPRAG